MHDCIFCKILAGDIPSTRAYEDEDIIAFDDINPAAPVHVLIIPRKHISTLDDTTDTDALLLGNMMLVARQIAHDRGLSGSGYRLVLNTNAGAGQTVFHIHLHVVGGRPLSWPPG